ncbi:MAG TPA: hypothetical protein VI636_23785 [Candidatus Angelobacter sp.]
MATTATAPQITPSGKASFLDSMGKLVALAAAIVGVVTALGLPAVEFQYYRLQIPMQFITQQQLLRAGILPGLIFFAVLILIIELVRHPERLPWRSKIAQFREERKYGVDQVLLIVLRWVALVQLTTAGARFLAGRSLQWIGSRLDQDDLRSNALDAGTLIAGFIIILVVVVLWGGRLSDWFSRGLAKAPWSTFEVLVEQSGLVLLLQWESERFWRHSSDVNQTSIILGSVLYAVAVGLIFGALVLLPEALRRLDLPGQPGEREGGWFRKWILMALAGFLLLLSAVTAYTNNLYPAIPYAFGGGKPSAVALWIDKKDYVSSSFAAMRNAKCADDGGQMKCTNLYLIYVDADTLVLCDGQRAFSTAVVLPRLSVKAFNH